MGAAPSRGEPLSNIIKEWRDGKPPVKRAWRDDDRNFGVVSYTGWHGVGISTAAKAVAKAAKEHKLFDLVILVTAGEECSASPRKLQRRIAKELRIIFPDKDDDDDDDDDNDYTLDKKLEKMIFLSLEFRKFLLVVDSLLDRGRVKNFEEMGVPIPKRLSQSRIFITTQDVYVARFSSVARFNTESLVVGLEDSADCCPLDFDGTSHGVLELFREEAGHVASTLNATVISADQVFHCFLYLFLFRNEKGASVKTKELTKYYIGEGFIPLQQQQQQQQQHDDDVETAFLVGKALLGEMVSRRMVEASDYSPDGPREFAVNSKLWKILARRDGYDYLKSRLHIQILEEGRPPQLQHDARWITLANNKIRTLVPQHYPLPTFSQLSTLLLNDNPQLEEIPPDFFQGMPTLKVLDLSRTAISSLPPSVSCLVNLTFLKLQQCSSLNSLTPSLKDLKQLLILDVAGTPLSNIPQESFDHMHCLRLIDLSRTNIHSLPPSISSSCNNLRRLDLSHTNIHSLPPSVSSLCNNLRRLDLSHTKIHSLPPTIFSLCNLQQLLLVGCTSLKSVLPAPTSSLINLTSLKKLNLAGCKALEEVKLSQLRQLSTLEELDISECEALKDVEDFSFEGMPNLRAMSLSYTPRIARLSLRSCGSLESVRLDGLTKLKSLDLSGTKIREFPHEISTPTSCLEHLDLTNMRYLESVNWEKIARLPEELKWVEEEQAENRDDGVTRISVSNPKVFSGLRSSSPLWDDCFSKFHFYISPCSNQGKKKTVVDVKRRKPLVYASVHLKITSCSASSSTSAAAAAAASRNNNTFSSSLRHFEIEGVNRLRHPTDIEGVVSRAKVLSLRDNGFLKSLFDIIKRESDTSLEECWVERCHNMESLYPYSSRENGFTHLKWLWMSELKSLVVLHRGLIQFHNLKHLHIECCPKLKTLFDAPQLRLRQLEILIVRFCARIECLLRNESSPKTGVFPKLHTLHLWELPNLEHICSHGSLPALQKLRLRVRACPKLRCNLQIQS
ncbi:hypothetical protein ACLOJK_003221 [Asimina triloba]